MPLIHAFEFLTQSRQAETAATETPGSQLPEVVIACGSDAAIRAWVMTRLTASGDVSKFDGDTLEWIDLRDELSTASLFSAGQRQTVAVRQADGFIRGHRKELESFLASPGTASRLVLDVESFPRGTNLYKAAMASHLLIDCSPPRKKVGRNEHPDSKPIIEFLVNQIAPRYQTQLTQGAAAALLELIGDNLGALDSEIAKLAVHLDVGETIDEALVRDVVAGWIGKTMWDISDAAAAGKAAEALQHIDKLLRGGQTVFALMPQLSWSLRRLAMATVAVYELEGSTGRRASPRDGLSGSGFFGDFAKAEAQMKHLKRARLRKLFTWLLEADLKLKLSHSRPPMDRWMLEELICKLAPPAKE